MYRPAGYRDRVVQRLQQIVQVVLQAFAQHKTVLAGKAAGVLTGPTHQVVGLRDNDELL